MKERLLFHSKALKFAEKKENAAKNLLISIFPTRLKAGTEFSSQEALSSRPEGEILRVRLWFRFIPPHLPDLR